MDLGQQQDPGISYDGNGQISAYNLGDPTGAAAAAGMRRTVYRDSAGRITGYTHTSNGAPVPALDQSFGYDNLNRLTNATQSGTAIQYSYDATGNRTAKAIGGNTYPNTISATSNKLTQTQDITGTATVVHDAAGNITSDGTNTYTYSDRGRLATMTNAGGTVTYSYNALELRVGKTGPTTLVPTGATYYVYHESGTLLGEYDTNGTPVYETVYLGVPVGVIKQTGTAAASNIAITLYNASTDQLGAPRIITRQSDEAPVWRWDSAEAFGATAPDQNPSSLGTFSFNQRLPGQVFDAESGLFQNWNREYNPRIGRYMQSDPIGLAGGVNTFAYVEGSPIVYTDPSGLEPRKLDPNSQECRDLKRKIDRRTSKIADKARDIYNNPQDLPVNPSMPGLPDRLSQKGHAEIIEKENEFHRRDIDTYNDKCGPPPPPATVPASCPIPETPKKSVPDWVKLFGAAAGATAITACIFAEPCGAILGGGVVLGGAALAR